MYDAGEKSWATKLHVGCGGIYLDGYINVDIEGDSPTEDTFVTDVADYYAGLSGDKGNIPRPRGSVADVICDMRRLSASFDQDSADKILAVQCLEHLDPTDVFTALAEWVEVLKPGGVLIVSVPDTVETILMMRDDESREFAIRHFLGSRKNQYAYHRSWWTEESLINMLAWFGFKNVRFLENFHFYPALVVRAEAS